MQENYQPQAIEQDVQKIWEESGVFNVQPSATQEKYYCLSMFPYRGHQLYFPIKWLVSIIARVKVFLMAALSLVEKFINRHHKPFIVKVTVCEGVDSGM
jgi:hypothetical protein